MSTTTYVLVSGSEANCTVTPATSADGNFTITPGAASTAWSFKYEIYCDGVASGSQATVSGTVATANPVAVDDNDSNARTAGVAFSVSASANDTPCPSGVTTYVFRTGSNLNCTVSPSTSTNGTFNVTPTSAAVSTWSMDYEIYCNGAPTGEIATISGTVAPAVPVAVNDTDTTPRQPGAAFNSAVQGNDTPCGAGATTYVLTPGSPVNCTVTGSPSSTGTFSVTVTAQGQWSYDYEIYCGGQPSGAKAKVTGSTPSAVVTADAVNDDVTGTRPNVAIVVTANANDTVCSSGATTYRLKSGSLTNCTVSPTTANSDSKFTTTPTAAGAWSFQYDILCDGTVVDTATVSGTATTVTADAVDDAVSGSRPGVASNVNVTSNDTVCSSGATTYALKAGSSQNVTVTEPSDGNFAATPTAAGAWSFQYDILCDGTVVDTATVSGNAVAAGPTADAVDDTVNGTTAGTATNVTVTGNDTACSSGATTYALKGSPTNATVTEPSDGTFSVTPAAAGAWSFQYDILCDGTVVDTATVSGNAAAPTPTGPVAVNDAETTKRAPGTQFSFSVTGNDTACGSGATTYELIAGSEVNCTIGGSPSSSGSFNVTPGSASCDWSFRYRILCGGTDSGQSATVSGKTSASGSGANLFTNPDWTAGQENSEVTGTASKPVVAGWTTEANRDGLNFYAVDDYVSLQTGGDKDYGQQVQSAWLGDPANNVPGGVFLMHNENSRGFDYDIIATDVNVTAGKTYKIVLYASNANTPSSTDSGGLVSAYFDVIVNGTTLGQEKMLPHGTADGGQDVWKRFEYTWTAPTTGSVKFAIRTNGGTKGNFGNDKAFGANMSFAETIAC